MGNSGSRLLDNGVGVLFTDDATKTVITFTWNEHVHQFASAKGILPRRDRDLLVHIAREEGITLAGRTTTELVNRLIAGGVGI